MNIHIRFVQDWTSAETFKGSTVMAKVVWNHLSKYLAEGIDEFTGSQTGSSQTGSSEPKEQNATKRDKK
eukprot:5376161-Amphidinium_carterae.1